MAVYVCPLCNGVGNRVVGNVPGVSKCSGCEGKGIVFDPIPPAPYPYPYYPDVPYNPWPKKT